MSGTDKPPIMFLTLDQDGAVVTVLHQFDLFCGANKLPQLTALADNCYDADKGPQTVFLQPNDICATVDFALPKKITDAEISALSTANATLQSPRNKTKQTAPLLFPLHPS
jgi:hypothetical protein